MAMLRLALVLALGLAVGGSLAEEVPVFVWGDLKHASPRSNPLEVTSAVAFEELVHDELAPAPLVVAFVEATLSVEDLAVRDEQGPVFPYLRSKLAESLYLPAVESPLKALNKIAEPGSVKRIRVTDASRPPSAADAAGASLLLLALEDARDGEPRAALLRRHDAFMRAACEELRALCLYTAHYPTWGADEQRVERSRRHLLQAEVAVANETEPRYYNVTGHLLLFLHNITVAEGAGVPQPLEFAPSDVASRVNDTEMVVTVTAANYTLELFIRLDAGYWFLEEADVTPRGGAAERIRTSALFSLEDFSYHCSGSVTLSGANTTYSVTLTDFQLQPFFAGAGEKFGDSLDCHGFTTVPIWSGLFVVFIMLAIFFYGVTMMMDIRTMDRFDDPKGKTITINASE